MPNACRLFRKCLGPSLAVVFTVLALAVGPAVTAADSQRPNVLLILADDLGFSDLGCYGSEIQTPNLDSVAEAGLRFTQFYNTARCWPTRGSLLTGYYPQQIGRDALPSVPGGGGDRFRRPDWAVLLPELLRPAGYRAYHTGKWHIDGMPIAGGFDRSYYLKDQGRFFNPTKHWKDDVALPPVEKNTGYYATTALADHAIEVLAEHSQMHADQPFFHYLAFAAPHFPLHALPADIAKYDSVYDVGWDVIRNRRWQQMQKSGLISPAAGNELSRVERDLGPPYYFPDAIKTLGDGEINKPLPWKSLTPAQQSFQAQKMAIHAAMIDRMDVEIGRVFDQIKSMDQWDNTIVIFLSDNGASAEMMVRDDGHDPSLPAGSAGTYLCLGPGWSTTCNTPYRRHKTWTHEGGTSTPLIVSWPDGIKSAGKFRRSPGHVIDVAATLTEIAGISSAADTPPAPGKSLLPVFSNDTGDRHESIWWFHDGHKALRMGDWKAVAPIGEPWELYDLSRDRDESNDLAVVESERLGTLVARWHQQTAEFTELATRDLSPPPRKPAATGSSKSKNTAMNKAQAAAKPKRGQVLINADTFLLSDRHAFVMKPVEAATAADGAKPWIMYAPTLKRTPDQAERWMHQQFMDSGVAVAGIDVGEMYGSPLALPFFDALYDHMVRDGYSSTPAILGRSRGGLWASSWAIADPSRVAGLGCIYPVFDYTTYPGAERAAVAYGTTASTLVENQNQLNPIRRAAVLARGRVPVFIIHGTDDKVVPIEQNSESLATVYTQNGAGDLIKIQKAEGQGHSYWDGFFHCQELVDFLITRSTSGRSETAAD